MAARRKHIPEGDTPGKPPEKKQSVGDCKKNPKRLSFTDEVVIIPVNCDEKV